MSNSSNVARTDRAAEAAPFAYGGQAVIEGVMMRGKKLAAVALRLGDGTIEVHDRPVTTSFPRKLIEAPFVRGFFLLWDMLGLGMWALNLSQERYAQSHLGEQAKTKNKVLDYIVIGLSLALALVIFKALPTWITQGLGSVGVLGSAGSESGGIGSLLVKNVVEGLIRLAIFVGYIVGISRLAEIRRVFEYHGAEHTVINAHESDKDNHSLDFIASFDTLHPRCGTSFIVIMVVLMVILMSLTDAIIVRTFYAGTGLSWPPLWVRLTTRLAVVPVLSGISYEIIRNAFRYRHIKLVDWFLTFGMAFQRLTTRKPDRGQLECGLASLMRVREVEEGIDVSRITFESPVRFKGRESEVSREEHKSDESEPIMAAAGDGGEMNVE
ncbi:MAG: DUF1385 domain-containing protein [bacterium]